MTRKRLDRMGLGRLTVERGRINAELHRGGELPAARVKKLIGLRDHIDKLTDEKAAR